MFDLRNHFCRKCYQEIQYLDSQPAYLSRLSSESRVACRGGQAFATQVYSVTWKGYISVQYCSDNSKNLINVSFLDSNVIMTTHSSSKKRSARRANSLSKPGTDDQPQQNRPILVWPYFFVRHGIKHLWELSGVLRVIALNHWRTPSIIPQNFMNIYTVTN